MTFPKVRVAVSAILFLLWIGFLCYLVARTRDVVILSRPQLLAADLVVLADIKEQNGRPDPILRIDKVLWAERQEDCGLAGQIMAVPDLVDCLEQGWRGPGRYLVPLSRLDRPESGNAPKADVQTTYRVTPLPRAPGHHPKQVAVVLTRVGDNRDEIARLAAEYFQIDAGALDSFVKSKSPTLPWLVRSNVPLDRALDFKEKAERLHAGVRLDGDTRIYEATPDALAQWEEYQSRLGAKK